MQDRQDRKRENDSRKAKQKMVASRTGTQTRMAVTENKKRKKGRNGSERLFPRLIHRTWKQLDSVEKEKGDSHRTLAWVTETMVPSQKEKGQKGRTGDSFTERLKL